MAGNIQFPASVTSHEALLLLGHPCCVLKGQLGAANLLLAQVNVLPELSDGVQGSVVLETQAANLRGGN